MKIEIKNKWTGEVIFAHDCDNNSVRVTVQAAIRAKVNLRGSDLRNSDLRGSDLSGSDLSYSNLSGSNLSGSNLSNSDVDYSSGWTFACSCSRFKVGISFMRQALAHLASLTCDDPEAEEIREKILPYALKSHRAGALGLTGETAK